ncbi:MAG: hypothetical protein LRY32_06365 [Flavobacterium sp.]|nr:hypothetical protein [Flavobacterium sp.]
MSIDKFSSNKLPKKLDTSKAEKENNSIAESVKRRYDETTDLRNILAKVFSIVIVFWLVSVILILVGNTLKYKLSDTVLVTLLTTTTIQVLGLVYIILKDLFPGGKEENKQGDK